MFIDYFLQRVNEPFIVSVGYLWYSQISTTVFNLTNIVVVNYNVTTSYVLSQNLSFFLNIKQHFCTFIHKWRLFGGNSAT